MALSKYERKEKLPNGAQSEIAAALDLSEATVSLVMNEKDEKLTPETRAEVREAIAARIRREDGGIGLPVDEVFAPTNEVGSVT